jgi:hypothetical protein
MDAKPASAAGTLRPLRGARDRGAAPASVRHWILPMVGVIAMAVLFCTAFYVIDAMLLGGGVTSATGVLQHYLAFDADLITDALPALGMTIVAVLGIVLTVVAIIVQLSSDRYTGVAMMFMREPIHIVVLSFYIVASLCAVWLSVTLRPDFVPRSLLLVVMVLTSLGLAIMPPYFAYTFWFLEPGNIIHRLRLQAARLSRRGLESVSSEQVDRLQGLALNQMEEITDIANNSIEGRDRIIAGHAIDALCEFAVDYIAGKPQDDRAWYRIGRELRETPDFVGMDAGLIRELESRRLWVEWKTMHEYLRVYHEALEAMGGINAQVAIDTRYIGEAAASRGQNDLVRMVFRFFNSFLRAAIDRRSARAAADTLLQYRLLIEALLRRGLCDFACEGAGFIHYFGRVAFEEDLPSITETAAYDLASLCQFAYCEERFDCEKVMLQHLLTLDAEESSRSDRQRRGLHGVRLAQTKLAVFYLAADEEAKARMVAEDMCDMSAKVKAAIREELAEESPPHFWEVVDRGRNLHYLTGPERAKLDTFLDGLEESRA